MKQSLSNTKFMCQHGTDSPAFFMVLEIKDQITPTGSTLFSFIICCSGRSERQRIFVRSHLTPHWLSNPGGTSCGTSDPSQSVSRARFILSDLLALWQPLRDNKTFYFKNNKKRKPEVICVIVHIIQISLQYDKTADLSKHSYQHLYQIENCKQNRKDREGLLI